MNEDPTEALIRDLKEQNDRLKKQLASGNVDMNELKDMANQENLSKEGKIQCPFSAFLLS